MAVHSGEYPHGLYQQGFADSHLGSPVDEADTDMGEGKKTARSGRRAARAGWERAGPTDETLIALVADGDEAALGQLYDRYATAVFSLAIRITRDQELAEDITQEVFLRVWRKAATFTVERGRFATWLLSMTHHLAVDQVRRQRTRPRAAVSTDEVQVRGLPDPGTDIEEESWVRQQRALVWAALAHLPEAQRRPLELAYFGGLTQVEIAALLGDPLGTIKSRMRQGLLRLRNLLHAQGVR